MNRLLKKFETIKLGSLFVVKIVRAKPPTVEMDRWLELIFGLHERDIIHYKTLRAFNIPGFYKPVPHVRLTGVKIKRRVPEDHSVWVRFDLKYPNVIDIEAPIAVGGEPRIFQINRDEWQKVRTCLKPAHFKDRELHKIDLLRA